MTSLFASSSTNCILTLDDYSVNTSASVWHVPTAIGLYSFNFENLRGASRKLNKYIKLFIGMRLCVASPAYVLRELLSIRLLLSYAVQQKSSRLVDELTWMDVLSLGICERHARSVVPALGATLRAWDRSGVGGLSKDLRANLPSLDTEFVPGPSPVLTRCPVRGSLTRSEQKEAIAELRRAFDEGRVKTASYVNAMVILVLALRPGQVAAIKVRDVSVAPHLSGASHALEVTRLKQRRSRPGQTFTTRRLAPGLGSILELQCEVAKRWAAARSMEPGSAPLFPRAQRETSGLGERPELPGFEGGLSGISCVG